MPVYLLALGQDAAVTLFLDRLHKQLPEARRSTLNAIRDSLAVSTPAEANVVIAAGGDLAGIQRVATLMAETPAPPEWLFAGPDDGELAAAAVGAGAYDYLSLTTPPEVLTARLTAMQRNLSSLQQHRHDLRTQQTRAARLRRLIELQSRLTRSEVDLDTLLVEVAERSQEAARADGAAVGLLDGDELVCHAASGRLADEVGLRLSLDASLSGLAVRSGETQRCADAETDPRVARRTTRRLALRSLLVVPLQRGTRVLGVLNVSSAAPEAFDDLDEHSLELMAEPITHALERAETRSHQERLLRQRSDALAALRDTTARLKAVVEHSPLAICGRDHNGRVLLWNPAAERFFGWSAEEVLGQPMPCIPKHIQEDYAQYNQRLLAGEQLQLEGECLTKDGRLLDVSISAAPLRDADERIVGIISIIADISEHVRDRRALRRAWQELQRYHAGQSPAAGTQLPPYQAPAQRASNSHQRDRDERLARALFEHSGMGVARIGPDGRWLEVNQRLCEILGYSAAELQQRMFHEISHPDDLKHGLDQAEKLYAGAVDHYTLEKRYARKNGDPVWISATVSAIRDERGELLEALAIYKDIDAQVHDEQRLRLFERALRASVDGVVISDASQPDQPVIYTNAAFERITGYRTDEVIGHNCRFLQGNDRDQAEALSQLREALRAGHEARVLLRNYRKDGTLFHNQLSIAPVRDAQGAVTHFIGVQNDVTAQVQAEQALRKARDELEQRVRERTGELRQAYEELSRSEEQLQEIARTIPGVLFQYYARNNGESGFYYISPRCEELTGLSRQDLMEDISLLPIHPDDRKPLMDSIQNAVEQRSDWQFELRIVTAEARIRWLRCQSKPVRMDADEVVFTGMLLDVTAEREAQEALVRSEQRFRALAEGSIEGIVVACMEDDHRPLYVNDAAAWIYGYRSGEELMRLPSLSHLIAEPVRQGAPLTWARLKRGEVNHVHTRVPAVHRDGHQIWVEILGTVVDWGNAPAFQMTLLDVTERQLMEQELQRLATTDALTGLLNRHQFEQLADQEIRRAQRHPQELAVLLLDVDHFKRINDQHGHAAGDEALRALSAVLTETLRDSDITARWGGEEFAALLLGADLDTACAVAERVRENCARAVVEHEGQTLEMTLSIGVSRLDPDQGHPLDRALQRADKALYTAKHGGRNRVEVA